MHKNKRSIFYREDEKDIFNDKSINENMLKSLKTKSYYFRFSGDLKTPLINIPLLT